MITQMIRQTLNNEAVKIQDSQEALKSDIILKTDSDALSNQLIIDNIESSSMLRDLSMSD